VKTLAKHAAELAKHPKVEFARVRRGAVEVKIKGGAGLFSFPNHEALQQFVSTHLSEDSE
jgi:hypothetical protein